MGKHWSVVMVMMAVHYDIKWVFPSRQSIDKAACVSQIICDVHLNVKSISVLLSNFEVNIRKWVGVCLSV